MSSAASTTTTTLLLFSIWVVFTATVESAHHSAAPAPAVDCSNVILGLADCLSFVTAGSVVTKPEGTCCSGLKTVLKTNAECLCEGFKNSAQLGVSLNMTKALSLPAVCHLRAPPMSDCGISIGAAPAPALLPSAMSPGSGSGSFELAPTTGLAPVPQGTSGSSILVASSVTLVVGLLVTSSHAIL